MAPEALQASMRRGQDDRKAPPRPRSWLQSRTLHSSSRTVVHDAWPVNAPKRPTIGEGGAPSMPPLIGSGALSAAGFSPNLGGRRRCPVRTRRPRWDWFSSTARAEMRPIAALLLRRVVTWISKIVQSPTGQPREAVALYAGWAQAVSKELELVARTFAT